MSRGWHRESARHSLAARGVKTKYTRHPHKSAKTKTPIVCKSKFFDCAHLKKRLQKLDLSIAKGGIYIMDTKDIIKEFEGDEEVEYDFTEEGYIAKMRDRYTDEPMILVVADKHPNEDQIILSVMHEIGHLKLDTNDEEKVEDWAYKQLLKTGDSYITRLD